MNPGSPILTPNVLHLDDGKGWRGGQRQVLLLAKGLAKENVRQAILAVEGEPLAERARAAGIEVIPWKFRGELDMFGPQRLARLAAVRGANILHAHTSHAHALGVAAARSLAGAAKLVSTRRVDFAIKNNWLSRRKYAWPGQRYIAISEAVRDVLVAGGVSAERVTVVHSGVPPVPDADRLPRDDGRLVFGIADGEFAVVSVGALVDHKDHRTLIDAAPAVVAAEPRARFYIIGEGELRPALEARIRELRMDRHVHLLGFIQHARRKLEAFDLYVQSSHMEGLGTAVIDAIWAGLPVVAMNAGGMPEIIRHGQTGRLAPPRNPAKLAETIIAALRETRVTEACRARALERVKREFSDASMIQGTLEVYRKFLEARD